MSAAVPRRATFDDLRVGQWVAWRVPITDGSGRHRSQSGIVAVHWAGNPRRFEVHELQGDDGTGHYLYPVDCDRDEVVILREAPAPPVTVRREDYDALRVAFKNNIHGSNCDRLDIAARALIDNADTGADQ